MGAQLKGTIPISDSTSVAFSREAEGLFLIVGRWYVEVRGGKLIVRADNSALNTNDRNDVLLKVDI